MPPAKYANPVGTHISAPDPKMLLQYRMENRIPPIKPTQAMMDSSFSMKVLFIQDDL